MSPNGRVRTALGLHPELAVARSGELPLLERLLPLTEYVGEIGLDGSRDHRDTLDQQASILKDILRMCARAGGKKVSLHSRGATGRVLDALASEPAAGTFVLHWYLGSPRQIDRATEMAAWFSVGPSMLRSARGQEAVRAMPRDRILPESDGPFGTIDDRPALPWEAWLVVPMLSEMWAETEDQVVARLMANFRAFAQ